MLIFVNTSHTRTWYTHTYTRSCAYKFTDLIATCTVVNVVYYFVSALVIQSVLPRWKCTGMRSDALEARDLLIPFDHCVSVEKNICIKKKKRKQIKHY